MEESKVLLRIENVKKSYPGVQALKGITTAIKQGEIRVIILASFEHRSCNTRTGFLYYSNDIPVTLERCS